MVTAESLADRILDKKYVEDAVKLMERLGSDDYTSYLNLYYKEGLRRYGENWRYADIVTVLLGLSELLKPESYLEIGVRRGRSVCAVASRSPECAIHMFDKWTPNYAGMDNPGPGFIESELEKIGHKGLRDYHNGNSHQTLKAFFAKDPAIALDLVTVDGDHSYEGAIEDICDVLPHLKVGGAVVFDDICHPKHLYLREVWRDLVEKEQRFTTWTCADIGYGVGFALRRW
ncbi:MAG: class I SAM-dependent methyltransferase [Nitrospirae bacterium]|nr:class I SAM-dependent methyltransferase [Nitrospirota bacterium]